MIRSVRIIRMDLRPYSRCSCCIGRVEAEVLRLWAEVEQQSDFEVGRSEIVVDLTRSRLVQIIGGFRLHDHLFVYDHVETLEPQLLAVVVDAYGNLASDLVTPRPELAFERHHIEVLEKAKSEFVVHAKECADDRIG